MVHSTTLSRGASSAALLLAVLAGCGEGSSPSAPADRSIRAPRLAAAVVCPSPEWQPDLVYPRRALASHAGHEWRAKKPNVGVEPGSHPAYWADQGACATDPGDPGDPGDPPPSDPTPIQIFGVWHAGDDYAQWGRVRDVSEFKAANGWILDRGDGVPSVNLVVLSFVNPLKLLHGTTDATTLDGVPRGMTPEIVALFEDAGIRVMLSIGGVTYTDDWNAALAEDARELGLRAAAVAGALGVGIEIDYEQNTDPDLDGLQAFIDAYRSRHPYDATGTHHAARLTIDLAAGGRYLQALNRHATTHWLDNAGPVLDYANAMVARSSGTPDDWQEHVDGKPQYGPPIPPKAPNRFTGGLYLKGSLANCDDFAASEQAAYIDYVRTVEPNGAGTTPGMLGLMFWAAETPSARKNYTPTTPPNSCEGGMGLAATAFDVPVPMPALRPN